MPHAQITQHVCIRHVGEFIFHVASHYDHKCSLLEGPQPDTQISQ